MSAIVEIRDLKKYFDTAAGKLHAVDEVSFSIEEGETMGIVGESGCGKSTLGRVILHLSEPTGGSIYFDGRDITSVKRKELLELRKSMQMVFQDPYSSLNPRMTASEIIGEPLDIYKIYPDKAEKRRRVSELMETVGLSEDMGDKYPHELDGGRRQRIGIARALALNPRFIVCDEPVSSLDVLIQAQILNLMKRLQKQKNLTYLFITHDLSVVKHISDKIGVMYLGRMVEKCDSAELFSQPLHPYTKALLSAIPRAKLKQPERIILRGEISSPIDPGEGCRFAARCPCCREQCRKKEPVLREIYPGHLAACHFAGEDSENFEEDGR